ncbi:MAG: hypothetical protein GXP55_17295 [Deltaproteobacteria bacterium]|nr:hypothetical protein [Deltaproteobacteria bacterium]
MADPFVTVARYVDPILAQMAVDVLRQEGIVATATGVGHSGVLGAAGSMLLQIPVQVRESEALQAMELLEALEEGGEVVDEDAPEELRMPSTKDSERAIPGEGPYRERRGEPAESAPRKATVGISVALFLTLGAGHFYARERAAALLLALAEAGAVFLSISEKSPAPMLLVPVAMAVDVFGVPGAVRRHNAGEPRSAAEQLLRTGIWLVLAAIALYFLGGAIDPEPRS